MKRRPAVFLATLVVLALSEVASPSEPRWKLTVNEDEISGETMHSLGVATDDGSVLVLTTREGKPPLLNIMPAKRTCTIFPDGTDLTNKSMSVNVTIRSSVMKKPHSSSWQMLWMNYGQAFTPVSASLAKEVFSGDSVTVQFDKTGKRIKFRTAGEGLDGFAEALDKTLDVVAMKQATAK
jgi:hypothetical protein